MLWAVRLPRRAAIGVAALAVGGVLIVQGGLFRWLDVQPFHPAFRDQTVLHQTAAGLRPGTAFDRSDYTAIGAVMPVARWLESYRCETVIQTLAAVLEQRPEARYRTLRPALYRAWSRAWMRTPGILLRHHACVSGMIWNPWASFWMVNVETVPNDYGLATRPLLPAARQALMPFVPALAHTVVLVLALPSAEYRLQYPVVLTGILAPLLAHALGRDRA